MSTEPRRPRSTLFPYTTLFRSGDVPPEGGARPLDPGGERANRVPRSPGSHLLAGVRRAGGVGPAVQLAGAADRKSTRLNSSHSQISYAVFCLKNKSTPESFGPV